MIERMMTCVIISITALMTMHTTALRTMSVVIKLVMLTVTLVDVIMTVTRSHLRIGAEDDSATLARECPSPKERSWYVFGCDDKHVDPFSEAA